MKIQVKRGTAAALKTANPVLASGEFCRETDTGFIKCGDGTTAWNSLQYIYPSDYDSGEQKNSVFDDNASNLGTISNASQAAQFVGDYHVTNGKFGSLKLNNRITIAGSALDGSNASWVIAGFDTYYNVGGSHPITSHHLGLIPATHLGNAVMNDTNTTVGGYVGSKMHTTTMATVTTKLRNTLGTHILMGDRLLSNNMSASLYNRYGSAGGASSGWELTDTYAELLTENQVYGSIVWSSSGYDTGEGKEQLPIFRFVNTTYFGRFSWWLRAVTSSTYFALVSGYGLAHNDSASYSFGVRPLIFVG